MITLRDYQKPLYDDIRQAIDAGHTKILAQADTGYGKSVIIGHLANELVGRTLVLTHRIELLEQNSDWINDSGVVTAKTRKINGIKRNISVISMAQTMRARFKKFGPEYAGLFDNVIVDEAHMDFFKVVYDQIDFKLVIGLTATPVINKTESKTVDGVDYVRKLTMADEFECLVQGLPTQDLIELGYLTQDFNIELRPPNLDKLVNSNSNPDGYTSASMTDVFGSHASLSTVLEGYNTYCKGKKTIIFNPTTAVNKKMHEELTKLGINCKMFDSVNKVQGQTRDEVVNWFRSTDNAVLLNVGVFTTGFSVNDLECIIYNKKTKSLGLWLQSVGRGSRILTKEQVAQGKIKDKFLVLDMGLNISQHGRWSMRRNWEKWFKVHPWKMKREVDVLQIWECKECGAYNSIGEKLNQETGKIECPTCGAPKPQREAKRTISGKLVVMEEPVYPSAKTIIAYVKRMGGNGAMALKMCEIQIMDLFKYHTPADHYEKNRLRYVKRVGEIYRPVYFSVLKDDELRKGKHRKLETELNRIITKVDKFYGFEQ